jgi:2'-5' RNA ligase
MWAGAKPPSDALGRLRSGRGIDLHAFGQTEFRPHVTLARIRGNGLQMAQTRPKDQKLSFMQRVETVELFQSPPPGEVGYRIVASARLGLSFAAKPAFHRSFHLCSKAK